MEKNNDLNLLSDETIVRMAQEGSKTAEEYLLNKYKVMALSKSKTYFITGGDNEDVIQEGMIGIFKAIRDFDEDRESSFRTFAELCVNRQIISAIKSANRQKHQILNESISLSDKNDDNDDDRRVLADVIPSGEDTNPESLMLMKEIVDFLKANGADLFSPLENKIWMEMLAGRNYREIAFRIHRTPKTVDNAMQRIKKKVSAYLKY